MVDPIDITDETDPQSDVDQNLTTSVIDEFIVGNMVTEVQNVLTIASTWPSRVDDMKYTHKLLDHIQEFTIDATMLLSRITHTQLLDETELSHNTHNTKSIQKQFDDTLDKFNELSVAISRYEHPTKKLKVNPSDGAHEPSPRPSPSSPEQPPDC